MLETKKLPFTSSSSGSEMTQKLEDVTSNYRAPCVMDIKMGTRTFLESEHWVIWAPAVCIDILRKMLLPPASDATQRRADKATSAHHAFAPTANGVYQTNARPPGT